MSNAVKCFLGNGPLRYFPTIQLKEDCEVYEERVIEVDDELEQLKKEKEEEITKRIEYATKYDTLSTYFKEKEDGLHCRLSELQVGLFSYVTLLLSL